MKIIRLLTAGALALVMGSAQAELFDRGGGLLYDNVLNVTWLQDANYAMTSGYDADGLMDWTAAKTWADGLVFHDSVRNVDYSDWRLAANTPVGTNWNYRYSMGGTTDYSYNITSPHSELSYMYYQNLGLKGAVSASGASQANFGIFGNGTKGGQNDVGLIKNLQSYSYWSGTASGPTYTVSAWVFDAAFGFQHLYYQSNLLAAWAVRDGDVAAVPEPETYAMLLAGLGLIGVAASRKIRS